MGRGLFITGTDTGVGKTIVAATLLVGLQDAGLRMAALKPVKFTARLRSWISTPLT